MTAFHLTQYMTEPNKAQKEMHNSRRVGQADLSTTLSHPDLLEPGMKGWKNGMARGDHIRVKFQSSGFKGFKIFLYIM